MKVRKIFLVVLTFFVGLLATVGLTSCGSKDPLKSLELKKDFENKDFFEDGIEKATVGSVSDGDTALFRLGNMSVNVRFYGINTPESTWQIEKWGKAASDFTKSKLKDVESIVLEGSETPPVTEGTGGRYLGFVWYQPKGDTRYYNLNLEIVLNGYSQHSLANDHPYYKYFAEAEKIAADKKLAIHGDSKDGKFDETLSKENLKDIVANPSRFDQNYVLVEATVKALNDKTVTIADVIDGKEYTFPVYLGYLSLGDDRIIRPGNRVKFVGRVSSHNGAWQLTGIEKELGKEDTTKVLVEGYEVLFGSSVTSFYHYDDITVTEVTTEGENFVVKGTTKNGKVDNVTVTLKVNKSFVSDIKVGNKIKGTAYNVAGSSFKPDAEEISLEVVNSNDIRVI